MVARKSGIRPDSGRKETGPENKDCRMAKQPDSGTPPDGPQIPHMSDPKAWAEIGAGVAELSTKPLDDFNQPPGSRPATPYDHQHSHPHHTDRDLIGTHTRCNV